LTLNGLPLSKSELARTLGQPSLFGRFNRQVRGMLDEKLIEYTVPEKPNSRLQKYRLTDTGRAQLAAGPEDA
jgi:ATP-dependent DNA helicase RecG